MNASRPANFLRYHVRKWFLLVEDTLALESGPLADGEPLRKIVVAAAIHNPYAGRFSPNLDEIVEDSAKLGQEFSRRVLEAAAGRAIQSYGKACVVGVNGEYEHGNAFLTAKFADPIRDAIGGGLSWVPSSGKRGTAGVTIDIPLAHKDALYVRSHYDTYSVSFTDTPAPDEVLVAFAVATRGRLHARLGGLRHEDVEGKDGLH